jgi:hypothetical protein
LGILRNTVRRYLRSETIESAYAERCPKRAINQYAFQLSAMLKTEAARSRKQRRTLKQIHEDLKELGFEGAYDRCEVFARAWRGAIPQGQFGQQKNTGDFQWEANCRHLIERRLRLPVLPQKCHHSVQPLRHLSYQALKSRHTY